MTLPLVTGTNDSNRQVSKDAWNNLVNAVNGFSVVTPQMFDTGLANMLRARRRRRKIVDYGMIVRREVETVRSRELG